jgi:hypothetical protein
MAKGRRVPTSALHAVRGAAGRLASPAHAPNRGSRLSGL